MHFNSFHSNRMDDIPDFLKRLQNKITYYVYKTVNDDDANEYAEKKKQDEVKIEENKVKENYNSTLPVLKQPTDSGIDIDRILTELYEYFLLFVKYVLYPLLCLYLSSLVANDLIVYPVGVRAVFFVLILFLCASFVHVTIGMSAFYTGRKLYEKYLNRERDDKPNPPIKLMPKIFAMLPISTTTSDSSFYNFFMYPFRYLKDVNTEKENTFLQELMKKYKDSLNESFPYYEKVKSDSMFVARKEELDKEIAEMHKIVKPKKVEEANASKNANASKEAPLPPTIQEQKPNEAVNKPKNNPLEASLPPTIQELENKKKQEAANKSAEAAKSAEASLPPTIQELENKKQEASNTLVNQPQEAEAPVNKPVNKPVNQQENKQEPVNKPLTEPVPPKI